MSCWRSLLALLILSCATARAGDSPVFKIPRVDRAPVLDDFREMKPNAAWQGRLAKVEGFLQREPSDGKPVSQRTEAYLGYDDKNLYVIFVCFDAEPGKIRSRLSRREALFDDDFVAIFLDTFHDRQHVYEFFVNPLGIQGDAISTEGSGDDSSFDTLWHSQGRLTPQGYLVSMSLPFKSLRFANADVQTWGVAVGRVIARLNEESFWPELSKRVAGVVPCVAT